MVFNLSRSTAQISGFKLYQHKGLVRHFILATDAKTRSRSKPEPWVVIGMSQHDHGTEAEFSAFCEAGTHKRRTDASALMLRQNRHQC